MGIYKVRTQRNRSGKLIQPVVNTKAKASTLEFIRIKFRSPFTRFTMDEFLDKKLYSRYRDDKNKLAKQKMRIKRLAEGGWLKKPDQEGKFDVTKKYKKYLERWGFFDNPDGPLMKIKESEKEQEPQPKKEIIEVEKIKEDKFLGEV
ncbi:hypothetical protein ES703_31401 [subsurface metagenome]